MKKKILKLFICWIIYFGVYILCDYLFDKNIDWMMVIASTIGFAIGEIIVYCFSIKKSNSIRTA